MTTEDRLFYKAKVKLQSVDNLPSEVKETQVLTLLAGMVLAQSSPKLVTNQKAVWENGEGIGKVGKDTKRVRIRVIDTNKKESMIGESFLDIREYALKVRPGTTKKFQITRTPEAGGNLSINISLTIAQKAIDDVKQSDSRNLVKSKEKRRPTSSSKANLRTDRLADLQVEHKSRLAESDDISRSRTSDSFNLTSLMKTSLAEDDDNLTMRPLAHVLLQDGRIETEKLHTPQKPMSASSKRFSLTPKTPKRSVEVDDEISLSPRSASSQKLVQRPTNSPLSRPVKYPTISTSKLMEEKEKPEPTSSKFSTWVQNDAATLKQHYARQQQESDEKFLVDNITALDVASNIGDVYVVALLIFKSLIHWDAFLSYPDVQTRVFDACKQAIKRYESSRTMLYYWLSTSSILLCLGEDRLIRKGVEEPYLEDFLKHSKNLTTTAFETSLSNFTQRIEPMLKPTLAEVISTPTEKMGSDPTSLNHVFSLFSDYAKIVAENGVTEEIKKQFFKRIFHFLATSVLDTLVQNGSTYSHGIQTKMIITKFEEWARTKLGQEISSVSLTELESAREAANILCLPRKEDLKQDALKQAVCPHLRPYHILCLLNGYRTDQFDREGVPQQLLSELKTQEENFVAKKDTFDPHKTMPLTFDYKKPVFKLETNGMILPKLVLDRPGFSFLKSNFTSSRRVDSKISSGEKW